MMLKKIYDYTDVFYADLDNPEKEIERIQNTLFKKDNLYYIFIKKNKEKKYIEGIVAERNPKNIKKYIFIQSELAGVGIDGFIVESDDNLIVDKLNNFFQGMTLKEYYKDQWIKKVLDNYNIHKIYKTDCDGDILVIYYTKSDKSEQ